MAVENGVEDEASRTRRAVAAREVEVLEAARHPGVVELLGVDEGPDGPQARTAPVDGPSLDLLPSLSVEEVAGVVAAVASTVADLHDLGLVHGGLTAEQVVVGADGRPVLRGFGHGGRVGEPPVAEADLPAQAADPARMTGDPLDPASDVFAVGALLRTLLDGAGGERRHRGGGGDGTGALRSLADRATVPDPRLRLSARALSAAVGHAVPGARLPRRPVAEGPVAEGPVGEGPSIGRPAAADPLLALRRRGGPRRSAVPLGGRRPSLITMGAAAALAVAVVSVLVLRRTGSTPPSPSTPSPAAEPAASAGPTTSGARSSVSTTTGARVASHTAPPARACPHVDAVLSADTDGDGCPEALRWADGVIEAGPTRWAVGRPGDLVATGDWACQGTRTLALLRPTSGDVFVFDGWAAPGGALEATALTRVDGGFALRTADLDADGCPELLVERAGGSPVPVPRPPRQP